MTPTAGDVHVSQPLTSISVAYMQSASGFVAGRVFAKVPVQKQGDLYYSVPRGAFRRGEMRLRAPSTESHGKGYTLETASYFCHPRALHHDIWDGTRVNADPQVDPDVLGTRLLTEDALITREKVWAESYFKSDVWATDVDGVATAPSAGQTLRWDDAASTPIEDVRQARTYVLEKTGAKPNVLVLGAKVEDKLLEHPDILARISGGATTGQAAIADRQLLAKIFGVEEVMVMEASHNSAAEGLTATDAFIGGKHALLAYRTATPGLQVATAGYTFTWAGLYGSEAGEGTSIKKFRMENLESDRIEIKAAWDMKVIASDLGYFFDSIIS